MSLNWANQLAKNALRNAQKKIDEVLDIRWVLFEKKEDFLQNSGTARVISIDIDYSIDFFRNFC